MEVNLIPTNNEVIASFRVTGYKDAIQAPDGNWYFSGTYDKSFVGNKFTIPTSDGFYTITDVEFLNVTNKSSDLVTVNMPSEFELGVSEISLSPIESNHYIKSFKVNGETFEGDSFIITENIITENIGHNITISDIVLVEGVIIESEHNPYPNSLNKVVYGEASFENATSLSVELTYQTESTTYDWIYLYDADGNIVSNKKYGGTTQKTETITVSGNYVKIVFRTDGSGNDYYGFKAIITPIYE